MFVAPVLKFYSIIKLEDPYTYSYRIKPYTCYICGKCFTLLSHLKTHIFFIHTGDKPHTRDACCKCFTLSSCLKNHIHIHTGDKSQNCDTCDQCVTDSYPLKYHNRIHTG